LVCISSDHVLDPSERVNVPLLNEMMPGGVAAGTVFVVEFDPQSQWFAVAATIAARFLEAGGLVAYPTNSRPVGEAERSLRALGVDVQGVERAGRLVIDDWYSATLTGGRLESAGGPSGLMEPIQGGVRMRSLKVADLSVQWLKGQKQGWETSDVAENWPPGALNVTESWSELLRFNEENPVVEWLQSRIFPNERKAKRVVLGGIVRGIHSESFYKRIEGASDGVIDIRVMERGDEIKNLLRVASLKGQPHDTRWHEIQIKPNGEAVLVA
jgi:KaiC/GvpD/RAD55 family RecA-like ATPase